jgi:hypothetical protein
MLVAVAEVRLAPQHNQLEVQGVVEMVAQPEEIMQDKREMPTQEAVVALVTQRVRHTHQAALAAQAL